MSLPETSFPDMIPAASPWQRRLAIRASAGSGKTYELTTRYLRVLKQENAAHPILATTFTRKAAGEILARVLKRLAEAAQSDERARDLGRDLQDETLDAAECRRLLRMLSTALHRVSISTLDSFFSRLLRCFPYDAGLPMDAVLLEGDSPAAAELRLEALRLLLAEGAADELIQMLDHLHGGTAKRSVVEALDLLVSDMFEVYRQSSREAWSRLVLPECPSTAEVQLALQALAGLAETQSNGHWKKAVQRDLEAARREDWLTLCGGGILGAICSGKGAYQRLPITPQHEQLYDPLRRRAIAELLGALARRTEATRELLERFDRHYAALRQLNRMVLFSDVPYALTSIVGAHTQEEIAYRSDGRIDHLLLDEFQDTSPEQWRILKPFALEAVNREEDRDDERGSFFGVGDVKQAIYGWRGGCAEIFEQLGRDLADLTWQRREASWRSSQVVLDAVNLVFSKLAANPALATAHSIAASAWQGRFQSHTAQKQLPGYVELRTSPAPTAGADPVDGDDPDGADQADEHEIWVAQRIQDLAITHPGASIGVLVRKNDTVRRLLFRLNQAGVAASGEGGSPVVDDPAIEVILSALTLADHPGDTAAAFHLTTSPHAEALGWDGEGSLNSSELAFQIRQQLLANGYAATLSDWAKRLAPLCDARGARRLMQLVELAEAYDARSGLRPSGFVRYAVATAVEEPSPARVRVMSIHKSKGLEFDLVVLPELHRLIAVNPPKLLVERPSPTAPIQAVYRYPDKLLRSLHPDLDRAYRRHLQAEVEESLCLLYVAMTRARQGLHLFIPPPKPNERLTHAAILRAALAPETEADPAGGQLLFAIGDPDWAPLAAKAVPQDAPPPLRIALAPSGNRRSWVDVAPSELEQGGIVQAEWLLDLESNVAPTRGTLIHAWFAKVNWLDQEIPDDEEFLDAGKKAVQRSHGSGAFAQLDSQSDLATFRRLLNHTVVRKILSRPADPGTPAPWLERPFAVRAGGDLVHGIFDRVVLSREAGRVVHADLTDFKTVASDPAETEPGRYIPQLEAYVRALQVMLKLDRRQITARLLFVSGETASEFVLADSE